MKWVNIFNMFSNKTEPLITYEYSTLPLERIEYIHKDIISYTEYLKSYMSIGLKSENLRVMTIHPTRSMVMLYPSEWLRDDDKLLTDLNINIKEFVDISSEFTELYRQLEYTASHRHEYVNISKLQPYIINIENIWRCLNIEKK